MDETPNLHEMWHVKVPGQVALETMQVLQLTEKPVLFGRHSTKFGIRFLKSDVTFVEKVQVR
jgi:hypothetical protein